jgi:hypothetical protein
MRRLAAVGFVGLSAGVGVFACIFTLFAADVVAASAAAAAGSGSWLSHYDAWQWNAVAALGLAGALVSVLTVRARSRDAAITATIAWVVIEGVLVALVWHASSNTGATLVVWQLAGAALLVVLLRRRLTAAGDR